MKRILLLLLLTSSLGWTQVGVNTTTPDPSSMLDVSSTNKGALFPRVSLSNINLTTLDGTNPAAIGLLIWNTNAVTVGGNGVGYYYFNGTIWIPISQIGSTDHDWYEIGTTVAPNAITDNMFHTGNVVIGKNTISGENPKLSIEESGPGTIFPVKIFNLRDVSTSTNPHTGMTIEMQATTTASERGIEVQHNNPNSTLKYGVISLVQNGSGTNSAFQGRISGTGLNEGSGILIQNTGSTSSGHQSGYIAGFEQATTGLTKGLYNQFLTNNLAFDTGSKYGMYNDFGSSTRNIGGDLYGSYNNFEATLTSNTNKYGSYTIIPSTVGGTHYGIYADATKSNSYAGYFLGRMSIGTTAFNNYILPSSRGTANQIMQTDGSGNVSWVNPSTIDTDNQQIDALSLTGDTLNISLQDDGLPAQTLNLAAIDNQATDVFSLTGNILNLSLQNDGVATQTVDLSSLQDNDWFEVGGINPPNAITDDKYTLGDTSIGKITAAVGKFDVDAAAKNITSTFTNSNNNGGIKFGIQNSLTLETTNGGSYGISNLIDGNADFKYGLYNFLGGNLTGSKNEYGVVNSHFTTGNANRYGVFNFLNPPGPSSGNYFGLYNQLNISHTGGFFGVSNNVGHTTDNVVVGVNNSFAGLGIGTRTGVINSISNNSTAEVFGIDSFISGTGTGNKFGERIVIPAGTGGQHFGVYSNVTKANSFAGYFLGNVSIGSLPTNNYILPASRGTNNQIMQTDGAGNVSWVDSPSDADWYEVGGINPPNAITDDKYTLGDTSIGKITAATGKLDVDSATKNITAVFSNSNTSTGSKIGIQNSLNLDTTNDTSYGITNTVFGNANFKYGILNNLGGTLTGTNFEYAIVNYHTSSGNVDGYGIRNLINPVGPSIGVYSGLQNEVSGLNHTGGFRGVTNIAGHTTNDLSVGIYNTLGGLGTGTRIGIYNALTNNTLANVFGVETTISGPGNGTKYGERITISPLTGGQHYGIYSDVTKANSFAGYFLGNVSVGTNPTNNYILPASRGTFGQIMVTNGIGDVSWVNPSVVFSDTDDQIIDVLTLTGNTLNMSLQDDAVATQTLDLSPIANTHWSDATTYLTPTAGATKDVLIGATSVAPAAKLTVNSNSLALSPQIEIIENQANDDAKFKFSNAIELTNNWSLLARSDDTAALNTFNINHTVGGNIVRINGEGRVGIMRTATTNAFEIGGDASKTTAGAFLANSDSRLKKNITTISPTDALNKVLSLRGVNYEWNDDKTGMKRPEGNQIGFVAQEIAEVFPEKVSEDKQGYLQTAYGDYDPIIFQAIKALSDKIDKLEKENEELKQLVKNQK